MKIGKKSGLWIVLLPFLLWGSAASAQEETEAAPFSKLAAVKLSSNAVRVMPGSVPEEITNALAEIVKMGGTTVRQGQSEVLAWTGEKYQKKNAPKLMKDITEELKAAGWSHEVSGADAGITMISITRSEPAPRALLGLWMPTDDALLLAWTELLTNNSAPATPDTTTQEVPVQTAKSNAVKPAVPATATAKDAITLQVGMRELVVNVMKNVMPKLPTFPTVAPKSGFVRGYVKDSNGKPLLNARIGVRSTAVGGAYSGAQGKTDDKGFYEIAVPFGAAHFYNAGYAIDYGEGRAAVGLHPADGELDSFASNVGGVENFVLLPFGIADRDEVQDNPRYANNYYGGDVIFSWYVGDERPVFNNGSELPANSEIEIILTPQTPLIDGSAGRTIILCRKIDEGISQLYVNNIPIATYQVSAKLIGGGALKMKEIGPNGGQAFGIEPKEATGTATLLLRPSGAKAEMVVAGRGNWDQISIALSR